MCDEATPDLHLTHHWPALTSSGACENIPRGTLVMALCSILRDCEKYAQNRSMYRLENVYKRFSVNTRSKKSILTRASTFYCTQNTYSKDYSCLHWFAEGGLGQWLGIPWTCYDSTVSMWCWPYTRTTHSKGGGEEEERSYTHERKRKKSNWPYQVTILYYTCITYSPGHD